MSMETLIKSIEEQGKKEMEEIRKACNNEVMEVRKKYEEEAKSSAKEILHKAETESGLIKERILSHAKIEAREKTDNMKHKIIDNAFENARKKILSSGDSEKKKILESLAEEAKKQMKDTTVFVDEKYAKLLPDAELMDINDFGVVLESADRREMVVNTLTEKMEQIKSKKRHDVAKVLFK